MGRRQMRLACGGIWVVAVILCASVAAQAKTHSVGPNGDWCGKINGASPGDTVEMKPGDYSDTCFIRAKGKPSQRIVVESADPTPGNRAKFQYQGASSNVIDIVDGASYITLKNLIFMETKDAIDAIKIKGAHHIRVESCTFRKIGGIAISANGSYPTPKSDIEVIDSEFRDLEATGMYFGCHNGKDCQVDGVRVEGNLIVNVDSDNVGYGLEVKLNSTATIRDNAIYNTKGPGLMVYGADQQAQPSIVEGNYVEGSRNDGAIVVGGGPAVVRNNVALGGSIGGIVAQDYGGRGLQQDVRIVHNTVLPSDGPGIDVQNWKAGNGNVIAYNAILPGQAAAMDPKSPAAMVTGNVTCADPSKCFVDAANAPYDLWPKKAGPLHDAGGTGSESWAPQVDFMGVGRTGSYDVGAFERVDRMFPHEVGAEKRRPPRVSSMQPSADAGGADDTGMTPDAGPATDTAGRTSDAGKNGDTGVSPQPDVAGGADTTGVTDDDDGANASSGCGCGSTGGEVPVDWLALLILWMSLGVLRSLCSVSTARDSR